MTGPTISRRRFLECLVAGGCAALPRVTAAAPPQRRLRASAIQIQPKLGDVTANLAQAEQLLDEAIDRGADWILLPEMFTSAAAFHEDILRAIEPADGRPAQLMRDKARRHGVTVGGSFLASENGRVHNRFLPCLPDGSQHTHDKDQPTYWEACYYEDGHDDGVLHTTEGNVGVALCWEMIRSRTARRLRNRVELLLAGSTWWTLPDEADTGHPYRHANLKMLQEAPPRLARLLGVPVIHASHAGPFHGFESPELPDVPYESAYLGESMICDSQGKVLGQRSPSQGAGLVMADITLAADPQASEAIPDRFWLPEQMPEPWKDAWTRWLPRGKDYYDTVTRPYLASGEINEYVPPYMRD